MGVDRRRFVGQLASALAALLVPLTGTARGPTSIDNVHATCGRLYPGPWKRLCDSRVAEPGRWAG